MVAWINGIPQNQREAWKKLVNAVTGWREEMLVYFETDILITNAFLETINRLARDNN